MLILALRFAKAAGLFLLLLLQWQQNNNGAKPLVL
jgi:hypothetical protein